LDIRYTDTAPDGADFAELFATTGWNESYRLTEDQLAEALRRSWHTVAAYDGGVLVGFGRTLCDGAAHALILDMIVLPGLQGRGIGSEILKRLVDRCRDAGIRDVQLFCARGKSAFYEKNGFTARPADAPGMELRFRPGT
jgi:GNAT superfamily N-acetyltransferase